MTQRMQSLFWPLVRLIAAAIASAIAWYGYQSGHTEALWTIIAALMVWCLYGLALYGFTGLWKLAVGWQIDAIQSLDRMHAEGQRKAEDRVERALGTSRARNWTAYPGTDNHREQTL